MVLASAAWAQRPGGEIRKRQDDHRRDYYEIFAEHPLGNHTDPAPMSMGSGVPKWPKSISIRAESSWFVSSDHSASGIIYADGTGPGTSKLDAHANDKRVARTLPKWALIARWVSFDTTKPPDFGSGTTPTKPISDWFLVGKGGVFDLPIPSKILPRVYRASWLGSLDLQRSDLNYTPLVGLQFVCNDDVDGFVDNGGWLHVYQEWTW